jgi:hypothetical protein
VIVDECCYEGNIPQNWGNIPAQELVHRCWLGAIAGSYVGHGETYLHPEDILWWSKGGRLHGESPPRIAFLCQILKDGPDTLSPIGPQAAGEQGAYYLFYFGVHQPGRFSFDLPGSSYRVEVIDPWQMTISPVKGWFGGSFEIDLPGRPYLAVRIRG